MTLRLAILLLGLAASRPVAAEPKPQPDARAEADATRKAKELFARARKLYQQARYAEAIDKFEEAYAIRPHPVVFFNIGKCWEQLGETAKALRAYRDYLRHLPDAPDKDTVADAIANLERRLEQKGLQQLIVFADPPNALIAVDGKVLGTSPSSVELTAGNHVLTVSLEGYETVERSFVMSTQRATEMTIALRPAIPPVPEVPPREEKPTDAPAAATVAEPPPSLASPASRRRTLTWAAAGVAVLGAGVGVGMGLMSNSARAELTSSQHSRPEADALVQRTQSLAMGANVSYGIAGAAAITAAVLYLVEGAPERPGESR